MGYEIYYGYHPKNEDGNGYNTDIKEEKKTKVGKPFDDTSLEKCAAAIMAQLARRDIWVVDVQVFELVKKEVSFKEAKDGRGIVLKNKKFSLNSTAEMVAEVEMEQEPAPASVPALTQQTNLQPHEMVQQQDPNNLYSNPNQVASARRQVNPRSIDRNKVLYHVYFEPYFHAAEAKSMKLKFTEDKKYPVHMVIPSAMGKLDQQQIAVTDDSGQLLVLDEKFFTSAGHGLVGDAELGFSDPPEKKRQPKLAYEDQMHHDHPLDKGYKKVMQDIPVDDGGVPSDLMNVPDLRPGR